MGVMLEPDPIITCIDCGGRAHLLTPPRRDLEDVEVEPWQEGDIVAYRCEGLPRPWDVVLADETPTTEPTDGVSDRIVIENTHRWRLLGSGRRGVPGPVAVTAIAISTGGTSMIRWWTASQRVISTPERRTEATSGQPCRGREIDPQGRRSVTLHDEG